MAEATIGASHILIRGLKTFHRAAAEWTVGWRRDIPGYPIETELNGALTKHPSILVHRIRDLDIMVLDRRSSKLDLIRHD